MRIQSLTISYATKRSRAGQSVDAGMSLVVSLEEGEKTFDAIKKYRPGLRDQVNQFAAAELDRVAPIAPTGGTR